MQQTSEFRQIRASGSSAATVVASAQELAASAASGFTAEANEKALFVGDLSALAAVELTRRSPVDR